MNLTTNEMFNYKRYPYLRDKRGRYQNPFSRGPIMNLIEFFVCLPDKCDEQDVFYEENIWSESVWHSDSLNSTHSAAWPASVHSNTESDEVKLDLRYDADYGSNEYPHK